MSNLHRQISNLAVQVCAWTAAVLMPLQAAPIGTLSFDAAALAGVLAGPGITINSALLPGPAEAGTFTDVDPLPIFFSSGVFLSTGSSSCLPGPNDQAGCTILGITPARSELSIEFTPALSSIEFRFAFGSDEFPESVSFAMDEFTAEVNGINYARLSNGAEVTVANLWLSSDYVPNHSPSSQLGVTRGTNTIDNRTQLDGFTRSLIFRAPVNPGIVNTLRLSVSGEDAFSDSFALLEAGSLTSVPEPSGCLLIATGAAGLAIWRLRRRKLPLRSPGSSR